MKFEGYLKSRDLSFFKICSARCASETTLVSSSSKKKMSSLPRVTELPDGRAEVDMRHRIPVPSDDVSSWTEQMCLQAFGRWLKRRRWLAILTPSPFFARIELPYRQFDNWRKARGYRKPTFWAGAAASNRLEKPKRGRPAEYNWVGVKKRLVEYANKQGPVQNWDELIQKMR